MGRKITTQMFIDRAIITHGHKFDYSKMQYVNYCTPVIFVCKEHGEFTKSPRGLLVSKSGCRMCSKRAPLSTSSFISKANATHYNKYDYTLVEYKNIDHKVKIVCNDHGEFMQSPYNHINGAGCQKCAGNASISNDDFISKANQIHNFKYDYSKTYYARAVSPVTIICKEHGEFTQTARNHTNNKAGCPVCSAKYAISENAWLDSFDLQSMLRQHKIIFDDGKYVFADGYDPLTNTVYEFWGDYWHGNPDRFNLQDINSHNGKTFNELYTLTQEKKQKYTKSGYNIVDIWENKYKDG